MKSNTISILLLAASILISEAKETIVAISPDIPEREIKNTVYAQVLKLALQDIAPGDTLQVLDGYQVKPIASFTVPSHQAYANNPKARAAAMKTPIQTFTAWMKDESPERKALPDFGLRAPMLLQYCAKNTSSAKESGAIIMLGSLIYDDPAEPAFSMKDGFYPSDAHLAVERKDSVYGLKGQEKGLDGVAIYWISAGSQFQDDGNRASVERWWCLYAQGMGAVLASCDPACEPVLKSFINQSKTPITSTTAETGGKLEMRHAPLRIRVPAAEQPKEEVSTADALETPVVVTTHTELGNAPDAAFMMATDLADTPIPSLEVENCRIGIRWPGDRDIDLYVRPFPGAEELFYSHQRSAQGIHVKDWLTSPDVNNNGFETVEIKGKIDLSRLQIAANFYAGAQSSSGVSGSIRIQAHGRIYEAPFHITSTKGNRGADSARRHQSTYWTIIDPLKVLRKE